MANRKCEVSETASKKFMQDVNDYADESVMLFWMDARAAYSVNGINGLIRFLKKVGLWDHIVDTYQQHKNKRFVKG